MIAVLAGGVGGARFLQGVVQVVAPDEVTAIVNTGDDREFYGLYVSPDVDIVIYTLAGVVDEAHGWGLRDDTYHVMQQLTSYGHDDWFVLGDRDLATHIHRTLRRRQGRSASEIADELRRHFGLRLRVLPMSDDPVATHIQTPAGLLHFQEYMVRRRCMDEVQGVVFLGSEEARPAPGVLQALAEAEAVLLAPSNPIVSIGSILAVPGVLQALQATRAPIAAVSPIVGGAPLKGPADKLMRGLGAEVSALGVARHYAAFLDLMVIDTCDAALAPAIEALGLRVLVTDTIMRDSAAKARLAREVLQACGVTV
jgi:LPPG:FO 2-phospho-L-lactate transferase